MWNQTSARHNQIVDERPVEPSAVMMIGALSASVSSRASNRNPCELRIESDQPLRDARANVNGFTTSIWSARHDGSIAFIEDLDRRSRSVPACIES